MTDTYDYYNIFIEKVLEQYNSITSREMVKDDLLINYDVIDDTNFVVYVNTVSRSDNFRIFLRCKMVNGTYDEVTVTGMTFGSLTNFHTGQEGVSYIADALITSNLYSKVLEDIKRFDRNSSVVEGERTLGIEDQGQVKALLFDSGFGFSVDFGTNIVR